jgi:hypothetical protein
MGAQVLGRANIKMDGQSIETEGGAQLNLGGVMRTTRKSSGRVVGYSEEPQESRLECQVLLTAEVSLETFRQATAVTLSFEADTGQTYSIANAHLTEPPQVTAGASSSVRLIFEGPPADEVL